MGPTKQETERAIKLSAKGIEPRIESCRVPGK
jgi:hypothetical protein